MLFQLVGASAGPEMLPWLWLVVCCCCVMGLLSEVVASRCIEDEREEALKLVVGGADTLRLPGGGIIRGDTEDGLRA